MNLIFKTTDNKTIEDVTNFIEIWQNDSLEIATRTSGSTSGSPKTISILKKHMIASAKMTGEFLGLSKNQNALLSLPISSIGGKMMVVRAMVLDLNLIVVKPSKKPLKDINDKIHFAAMTPMQVQNSFHYTKEKFNKIETLIIGGAPLPQKLEQEIISTPVQIFQTFGMTETISHIAMRNISERNMMYEALPNIHFSIQDSQLIVHARHLGIKSLQTNDIVKLIGDSKFIWFGRKDSIINSGGIKISPEDIASKIDKLISKSFFSTGIFDKELGEKHVLFIESKESDLYTKDDFSKFLSKYEVPKEIYYLTNFSYTHSGKIDQIATKKRRLNAQKQIL